MLAVLIIGLWASSCAPNASQFLGSTKASYSDAGLNWDSNKNQENLDAEFEKKADGSTKFKIKTTATTPESSIAAMAAAFSEQSKLLNSLLEKILAGAQTGAVSGS